MKHCQRKNGTEIHYITWIKFDNHRAPSAATSINYDFGNQVELASVANWAIKWHNLHWFKI